ncbi:hypothetical protein LSM04_006585 [Trypanosoma melophagium]|uniref:uncharacterized protein n=1 Tax=Trypanosoma melophagium TaxID=715481 RepID=UPI00351A8CA9|nr:hypothetical protein LSM04_006585 [Trypanosoma melophagium]
MHEMDNVEPCDVEAKVAGLHEEGSHTAYVASAAEESLGGQLEDDVAERQNSGLKEPVKLRRRRSKSSSLVLATSFSSVPEVEAAEIEEADVTLPDKPIERPMEYGADEPAEVVDAFGREMDGAEPCDVEAKVAGLHEEGSHTAYVASAAEESLGGQLEDDFAERQNSGLKEPVKLRRRRSKSSSLVLATSFSSVPEVEAAEIEEADVTLPDKPIERPMEYGADEPAEVVDAFGREMDGAEPCDVEAKVAGLHEEGSHTAYVASAAEESLGGQLEDDVAERQNSGLKEPVKLRRRRSKSSSLVLATSFSSVPEVEAAEIEEADVTLPDKPREPMVGYGSVSIVSNEKDYEQILKQCVIDHREYMPSVMVELNSGIDRFPPLGNKYLTSFQKSMLDTYYSELKALRDTLVSKGKEVNAPAIQCVEEQMKDRLEQLRADAEKAAVARQRAEQRLLEQHPYLEALEIAGLPLSELGLSDDDEFVALAEEHATLAASPRANAEALAANEQSLRTRAAQLAATLVKKEAALREQMPYLDHLPVDVPLRELHLESDPEFTALLARYAAVCSEPERAGGPEARRLEKAMHDFVNRIVEDVATARHRALLEAENLHEKYPYIPEEPAPGVALVEVGVHEDPTFCKLANELEDLRTDPVKNAEQIAAVESAVCARAVELAAMKLHATEEECHKYPFLSKRVDGVLLSDLDLADDAVFQEMVERRGAMTSEPQRNREALAEVESQLRDRASCVAAMKKAVDALRADEDEDVRAHNPFLEMNEVKSVPLRELGLPSDPQYAALTEERLLLKQHPVPNAAAIVATENALRSRAEEIALARLTAEDSEAVRKQRKRPSQVNHPPRTAQMDALPEEAAGDEIVDVDTQLPPKPQRALELVKKDPYYQELNALRDTLVSKGKEVNAPAIQCVEEQMKDRLEQLRADAEKAAVARQRAEQRLLEQHPYLEALEIAGLPLSELGLSDDDEFVALAKEHATLAASPRANAEALAANEQSLRTRAAQLAATLVKKEAALREQMPYLDHLPVDVPLRELHLESDPEFTALLARYAAVCSEPERAGGPEARRLEKAMHDFVNRIVEDVATARHRALLEAENLHEKYPYIPEEPAPGVALVEVGVHEDPTFCKLANELEDLRTDPVKNAEQIAAVESAVCARAVELAAMKLHATEEECHKYPFLSKRVDGVLLSDLDLADDAVFQEMVERRGAMTSEPQRNREALAEVESQLRDRASCVAAMKKAVDALRADEDEDVRAHNPFLEMNEVKSVPLRELGLPSDPQYAALTEERLLLKQHPVPNAAAIVATENALRSRAEEIALARLTAEDSEAVRKQRKRPSQVNHPPRTAQMDALPEEAAGDEIVDVDTQLPPKPQRALELFEKDPYYQELNALRDTLVAEGKEVNAPAIQCAARGTATLGAAPYLEALEIAGLPLSELGLSDDDEFVALAKEHATLAASPRANAEALAANEQSLRTRAAQLAATLVKKEAALREQMPYLDHLPVDVPLRELHLESDPEFTALLARYAAVCSEPERAGGPEAKRLEKAMHDLAGKIAEDVATARHRALVEAENLHEKYPYIPEEPAPGVALVEVGVHEDPTFCKLANELEDLRTDPVKNAEQIAAVESAVCARALELAAMKLHATEEECHKYPFLSKRVDGVLLSDLDLADDAVFQEMVERRGAMTSEPQRNREALAEVESQLRDRASCVAAMKKAVDALRADEDEDVRAHNPFLEMNEVKSVPLRELGLPSDPQYAVLTDERLLLKQHPVPNAAAIVATENALRSRAEEIALARLTAEDSEAVRKQRKRPSQVNHPPRTAQMDALPEEAAGDEIVDVDTQLPPKPQRALELFEKDPYYQELNALRDTLVAEGKEVNAPAIQCVEEQMKDRLEQLRADAEKAAVARQRAEQRLLEQHPYLEALEIAGLPLSELGLSDDDEFVALAKEHATLAASPRANAEALAANEQSLRTRAAQLAATLVKKEAALREQMPYLDHLPVDVPLRELHLESDPEFTALLARYAAVCSEPERAGGPEAKRLEKAMHDLAGKIAEDVATARHRALVEAENLHEKYPYIPEEPAPGVALVEVGVHEDPTFRKLANELEDLRTDPVKNAEQIAAVESAVCARAVELAAMKLHATEEECHKYPFLSKRVDGVLLSDLDLADDAVFQEMVERRGAMTSEPQRNREALAEVESQLRDRASCVAAMKKAVDALRADEDEDVRAHNPFLEMNEVKSVPLRELGLPSDPQYAALTEERLLLKQHPVPNAAAIVATENALRSRAEEIALARLTAEDSEAVRKQRKRPSQVNHPPRTAQMDALPEEAAGDEIVDVDTQLPPKPQRALELFEKDPYYQELNALRDTLVAEGKEVNAPAIQCVEEQMKDRLEQLRADAEKAAVARQRAEQRLLEQHPIWRPWR